MQKAIFVGVLFLSLSFFLSVQDMLVLSALLVLGLILYVGQSSEKEYDISDLQKRVNKLNRNISVLSKKLRKY